MLKPVSNHLWASSLGRAKIKQQVEAAHVLLYSEGLLKEEFGNKAQRLTKPIALKNKQLVIASMSSIMASEIRLRSRMFIKKINQRYG
ncbi:MAG: DciA family protein, partial [Patescibacteria group bacterium]|nr:DciA family protein [Patescibacteria group bacterium]